MLMCSFFVISIIGYVDYFLAIMLSRAILCHLQSAGRELGRKLQGQVVLPAFGRRRQLVVVDLKQYCRVGDL